YSSSASAFDVEQTLPTRFSHIVLLTFYLNVRRCCHRCRGGGVNGGDSCRRVRPADAAFGEETKARRQDSHVGRHALQHHPCHRQPGHRRSVRSTRKVFALRFGRIERATNH